MNEPVNDVLLAGLDGSNLLAFLASLGTLRTLAAALPDERVGMYWSESTAAWRPTLTLERSRSADEVVSILHEHLQAAGTRASFAIGDDLNLPAVEFRKNVLLAQKKSRAERDRQDADFLAAFGCEACTNDDGTIEDTGLRTMSGAGHQHFLKFFRDLVAKTDLSQVRRALFQTWDYADDGRGLNLRWDPADDRRYAMRWDDPSGDPIRTMRGANRLAIEALPLIPTMPTSKGLATTCFEGSGARNTFVLWPIWRHAITLDVVRSVLANSFSLRGLNEKNRAKLGVVAMFASQRINPTTKYRNFAPARPV